MSKVCELQRESLRCLTKREIDRRIDDLSAELMSVDEPPCLVPDEDRFRPRSISAAELVRRVQPFLGMN